MADNTTSWIVKLVPGQVISPWDIKKLGEFIDVGFSARTILEAENRELHIKLESCQRDLSAISAGFTAANTRIAELEGVNEILMRERNFDPGGANVLNGFQRDRDKWKVKAESLEDQVWELRDGKTVAYSERDRVVCALSKLLPSHLERHPDSDTNWEDDWRWIVFVQFPTGQASWHIHDLELVWFDHLERKGGNSWDGHSTSEKYARIERFEKIGALIQPVPSRAAEKESKL